MDEVQKRRDSEGYTHRQNPLDSACYEWVGYITGKLCLRA
jgi:hypothetical protein